MPGRCIITIGNFDGVHVGHQAIVAGARQLGDRRGLPVLAMTFDPLPAKVLRPGSEPPLLMALAERLAALRAAGADDVLVLEPTPALLGMSAEDFLEKLRREHEPAAIVEGVNFHFGKGRRGTPALLRQMGPRLGFEAVIVQPVQTVLADLSMVAISSSLARWLLLQGRVSDGAHCLGRLYELSGQVVVGEQRGRTVGVPTVNLDPAALAQRVLPHPGVYAGLAALPDGTTRPAAISVGAKPTFAQASLVIEAHLLDYSGDLYGQPITLRFSRWLRDQQPFPDTASLLAQIKRDIAQTRRLYETGLLATANDRAVPAAVGQASSLSGDRQDAGPTT